MNIQQRFILAALMVSGFAFSVLAEKVQFNQVPPLVQETIRKEAGNARIEDIDRQIREGRFFYEVGFKKQGQHTEIVVAHDGTLIDPGAPVVTRPATSPTVKTVPGTIATKLTFNDLPPAVQSTVRAYAGDARIEDIDRKTIRGWTVYQAAFKVDGKHTELRVAEDGSVVRGTFADPTAQTLPLPEAQPITFDQVTPAAQRTIREQAGTASVESIQRGILEGRPVYHASFNRGGVHTEILVADDGNLIDRPLQIAGATPGIAFQKINFGQLPVAVQNTVNAHVGNAAIQEISKATIRGSTYYQVTYNRDGQQTPLRISTDGRILPDTGPNIPLTSLPVPASQNVGFSQLPVAVQNGVRAYVPQNQIQEIERRTEDGKTVYEVGFNRDGDHHRFLFATDGTLLQKTVGLVKRFAQPLSQGVKIDFAELPPAVQSVIRAEAGGAPIEDIDRGLLNGRTVYEAAFKKNGVHTELRVAEDGTVVGVQGGPAVSTTLQPQP